MDDEYENRRAQRTRKEEGPSEHSARSLARVNGDRKKYIVIEKNCIEKIIY